jgi:hypothetical protein
MLAVRIADPRSVPGRIHPADQMRLSTTQPASLLRLFLSSGDDVLDLRRLVHRTVEEAINPVLRARGIPVRLDLDGWDRTAAHRVPPGETVNTEFVARACAAHLVLGLLHEKLGDGTREELEAVLAKEDVELSVIWCVERAGEWPQTPAGRWLGWSCRPSLAPKSWRRQCRTPRSQEAPPDLKGERQELAMPFRSLGCALCTELGETSAKIAACFVLLHCDYERGHLPITCPRVRARTC